jgi:hypothetical protein
MESSIIIGGKSKKHKRHESDFYPTPAECVHSLMDFIDLPLSKPLWEPACGDGAISRTLEERGFTVISTDLRIDSGYGTGGIDFLQSERLADIIITNPPFNLSEDFIKKCTGIDVSVFALLLKATYWHSYRRLSIFEQTKPAFVLPFTWRPNMCPERGASPTMDFLWTVWIKGISETKYIPLTKSLIW